ncbi:MAG: hypothetical protein BBJ60_06390 [Desulfobacterales bacterium S7086C20]|nr:MAG: hypothetical protein BBJ60_06390 [Desulfobacterales bacterium S7086C20]
MNCDNSIFTSILTHTAMSTDTAIWFIGTNIHTTTPMNTAMNTTTKKTFICTTTTIPAMKDNCTIMGIDGSLKNN